MNCPKCQEKGKFFEMKPGQAMLPVWGRIRSGKLELATDGTIPNGSTIYPVGSVLGSCLKCPERGHSRESIEDYAARLGAKRQ